MDRGRFYDHLARNGWQYSGSKGKIRCPCHRDSTPSLAWRDNGQKVLLHCFAGCSYPEVARAIEGSGPVLFGGRVPPAPRPSTYLYKSAPPELLSTFDSKPLAGDAHPYLVKKQVPAIGGLRLDGDELLIPMYDDRGNLRNIQRIYERLGGLIPGGRLPSKFEKRFLPGLPTKGLFLRLGKVTSRIHVSEGYANAATVHIVTGDCVYVAFSASNLPAVAAAVVRLHSPEDLRLAGDEDAQRKDMQ